jgi:hypothetical protein
MPDYKMHELLKQAKTQKEKNKIRQTFTYQAEELHLCGRSFIDAVANSLELKKILSKVSNIVGKK